MRTRRFCLSALALFGATSLSACGFTPMYGEASPANQLSDILIETGEERVDFYLQEALKDALNARNADGPYILRTQTRRQRVGLGVSTDEEARRYAVRIIVSYELIRDEFSEPVMTGSAEAEAGFNAPDEIFSIEIAERDAELRAAEAVAERIQIQLYRFAAGNDAW